MANPRSAANAWGAIKKKSEYFPRILPLLTRTICPARARSPGYSNTSFKVITYEYRQATNPRLHSGLVHPRCRQVNQR